MAVKTSELNGQFSSREYTIPVGAITYEKICEARPNRYSLAIFSDDFLQPTFVTTMPDGSGGGLVVPPGNILYLKVTDYPGFIANEFWLVPKVAIGTLRIVETWQTDG